jgi:cysteine desulfurase
VRVRERRAAGDACGDLLLYGATEHKAVPESLAHWNRMLGTGLTLQALPVDGDGRHRLDVLRELAPRAAMVCTMAANNETGVVSDLDGIAACCANRVARAVDGRLRAGARQAAARPGDDPHRLRAVFRPQAVCAEGHRHAVRARRRALHALMIGGGQEAGQRSGTENMAGIAAFGAVLAALEEGGTFRSHAQMESPCANAWPARCAKPFPASCSTHPFAHALPTTLNFAVPDVASKELLDLFDAAGVRVSAGSACSAAKAAPSYVLEAMGLPLWRSAGAVRLSFGPLADEAFIDAACARIRRCGAALRGMALEQSGAAPGILQLSSEGRHGWIVFDKNAGAAAVIDPPAPLVKRTAALLRANGLRAVAVLGTGADPDGEGARGLLRAALGAESADPGPLGSSGAQVTVGAGLLTRSEHGQGAVSYLLGDADGGARMAFVGSAGGAGPDAAATLVCHAIDAGGVPFGLPPGAAAQDGMPAQLQPEALDGFLERCADTLLVDVREVGEIAAGGSGLAGRAALAIPLSRLAEHAASLLAEPGRPVVFFCRSGNRSARAALCLHRLGHRRVLTLAGGLALATER